MLTADTVAGQRYRLREVIGTGGGADVYRADDLETGCMVAVKVLRSATPDDLRRFDLEAETLSRLDHPAIVRMCDRGEHDGVPYLVLDLIDGETLSARLQRGALSEDDVISIGTVLAAALAHAHSIGVVHRDVKPGNVLFDQAGNVHLTDFGIARLTDVTAITSTGLVVGTPAYLAPEQVTGEGARPASDVYALGLVLIEALSGERAFSGPPSEAALARLHRQPEVPPTRNRSLGSLLAAMTASEPHLRPEAATVVDALTVAAAAEPADSTMVLPVLNDATAAISLPVDAVPAPAAAPVVLRPKKSRAALVLVLAIALVLLIGFATSRGGGGVAPTTADPTTTLVPPTTAAPVTAPPTTAPPTTAPPKRKGKKGDGDG